MPIIGSTDKAAIGYVTSGCPSPCMGKNIAMAYVDRECAKTGSVHLVDTGSANKMGEVEVVKMPFVKTKYFSN
jgi:aminomethyltransferase